MTEHAAGTSPRSLASRLMPDRTAMTIVLAGVFVAALGALRDDGTAGLHPKQFWARKVQARHCADVVAAGDSRILRGIAPAVLSQQLGGARVLNYGFSAAGWSQEYMDAIEATLDPAAGRPTIILGVTPLSCTRKLIQWNGFQQWRRDTAGRSALEKRFASVLPFFEPMLMGETLGRRIRGVRPKYIETFSADGWASITAARQGSGRGAGRLYRRLFDNNPIREDVIRGLISRVAQWRARGIEVYAFRVPTTPQMVDLENRISGFDEPRLAAEFRKAGGAWIDMDQAAYKTYDGIHLHRAEAERLTHDLARMLRDASQGAARKP